MGLNAIQHFMMEEGMDFVGAVKIYGNVPCIRCGQTNTCGRDDMKMLYGGDATIESVGVQLFEEQQKALESAKSLGQKIDKSLNLS